MLSLEFRLCLRRGPFRFSEDQVSQPEAREDACYAKGQDTLHLVFRPEQRTNYGSHNAPDYYQPQALLLCPCIHARPSKPNLLDLAQCLTGPLLRPDYLTSGALRTLQALASALPLSTFYFPSY